MPSTSSKYRHGAFRAAKKRKKKSTHAKLNSPTKKALKETIKGSYYDQESLLKLQNDRKGETSSSHSASRRKLRDYWDSSSTDNDESDEFSDCEENSNEHVKHWIFNIRSLADHINKFTVCKTCSSEIMIILLTFCKVSVLQK